MATEAEGIELSTRAAYLEHRYVRAVDTFDMETLSSLITDDIRLTRTSGTCQGRDAFFDVYRPLRDYLVLSKHVVGNVLAERGADGAIEIMADFTGTLVFEDRTNLVIGLYHDTAREIDGELRFTHKQIEIQRSFPLPHSASTDTGVRPIASEE